MKLTLSLLILTLFVSCNSDIVSTASQKLLLKSSKEFITEDGGHIDLQYGSTQAFQKQHLKVKYLTDTIHAQAIQYVNSCGNATAWIELSGDTITLSIKEQSKLLCSSSDWYKYDYWITNPTNKKYIIKQKE